MAFNQAAIFLIPPRYGTVIEYDHTAKSASGKPVEIVSTRMIDSNAPKVITADLRQWLFSRGFAERERYGSSQVLFYGSQMTPFGMRKIVEIKLPLDDYEIQGLYIRFLLSEKTPDQISEWRDLILELGHDFGFQIMDEGDRLLPCLDFTTVLIQNQNFCEFQKNYGWKI